MISLLTALAAQAVPAPAAAPAGVPQPQTCLAAAPALGTDPAAAFPQAVDGKTLRNVKDIARLRSTDGRVIVVKGGDFSGAWLGRLRLSNICFIDTKFANTDWQGIQTSGIGFIRSDLTNAKLMGAQLPGVLLRESTLANVDATGANFDGGRLDGGWGGSLAGLKLNNVKLTRFQVVCGTTEVDGCPFDRKGLSVTGADFTRANIASFTFWDANLEGAILDNTHVGVQQIGQLTSLVVRGPIIIHSPHRHVTLSPQDYLTVRGGLTVLTQAKPREAVVVNPETCAAIDDRRDHAICVGGSELQTLFAGVQAQPRLPQETGRLASIEQFCVNLSDDLIPTCLLRAYRAAVVPVPVVAPSGGGPLRESTIFAALPIRFTDAFKRSPLYTRVLPVLLDVAPTQVFATVAPDGQVKVSGGSQSGCRIALEGLTYLPASGYYGQMAPPVPRRRGRGSTSAATPVIRFTDAGYEFAQTAPANAVECRSGGKFDRVVRIAAPGALVDLIAEQRAAAPAAPAAPAAGSAGGGD